MLIDSNAIETDSHRDAAEALLVELYSGMARDDELFASLARPVPLPGFDAEAGHAHRSDSSERPSGDRGTGRSNYAQLRDGVSHAVDLVVEVEAEIARCMARRARLVESARELAVAAEEIVLTPSALETGSRQDREQLARRSLVAELGCALRQPEASVQRLLTESETLADQLPSTLNALAEGRLSYRHAQVMVDNALSLPREARLRFEGAALRSAVTSPASRFTQHALKLRERLHPESMVARREKAASDRCLRFEPARDGMAWLSHFLPAAVALQIDDTVDNLARGLVKADETRTVAQLRSDVLVDLILGDSDIHGGTDVLGECNPLSEFGWESCTGPAAHAVPHAESEDERSTGRFGPRATDRQPRPSARLVGRGVRPTVIVTVPVMTLLGHTEEPGELEGYGPIDAETARELARHAPSFIRILTHPETGATLSVGRQRYRPLADLRTALEIDDQTCRFPGCSRAARRCELDHTVDWASGGQTSHSNLAHLCPKHHHLKHETKWAVRHETDRALRWTSPLGREYVTTPESRGADPMIDPCSGAVPVVDAGIEPPPF
ncbi:HNH endonuclease signature motif containing protein [Subtercola frigoramans]|uniref:HNH nuclease domain-containing protein n=1 Tax=Subtercola frigoramans TaxID=120298 RepID=A0ABS2L6S5_9MICO|nr:HNH endonuclease signature motif containing protein [Subtercola frigoramans]MBM7472784.1 hypothetical protein [Subtercola frigoramans]